MYVLVLVGQTYYHKTLMRFKLIAKVIIPVVTSTHEWVESSIFGFAASIGCLIHSMTVCSHLEEHTKCEWFKVFFYYRFIFHFNQRVGFGWKRALIWLWKIWVKYCLFLIFFVNLWSSTFGPFLFFFWY